MTNDPDPIAGIQQKLDDLIAAASRHWGAGSEQHNLVRDVADAVSRFISEKPAALGTTKDMNDGR